MSRRKGSSSVRISRGGNTINISGPAADVVFRAMTGEPAKEVEPADQAVANAALSAMGTPSIECPKCHMVSHNPNDVRERYCGFCREFHDAFPHLSE